jgi:hypothetical protein
VGGLVVNLLTLLSVIAYACFTYQLLCETRKQIKDYRSTQRAILEMDATWDAATQKITFTLENVGNSAASDIYVSGGSRECPIVQEGLKWFSMKKGYLEKEILPVNSNPGGFYLDAHKVKAPSSSDVEETGWIDFQNRPRETSFCIFKSVGYKDNFGDEGHTYACMYHLPLGNRWERCYVENFGNTPK